MIEFYLQFWSGDFPKLGIFNSQVQLEKKEGKNENEIVLFSRLLYFMHASLHFS